MPVSRAPSTALSARCRRTAPPSSGRQDSIHWTRWISEPSRAMDESTRGPRGDPPVLVARTEEGETVAADDKRGRGRARPGVEDHAKLRHRALRVERCPHHRQPIEYRPTAGAELRVDGSDVGRPGASAERCRPSPGGHWPGSEPAAGDSRSMPTTTIGRPGAATARPCVPGWARTPLPARLPARRAQTTPLPPMVGPGEPRRRREARTSPKRSDRRANRRSRPSAPTGRTGSAPVGPDRAQGPWSPSVSRSGPRRSGGSGPIGAADQAHAELVPTEGVGSQGARLSRQSLDVPWISTPGAGPRWSARTPRRPGQS